MRARARGLFAGMLPAVVAMAAIVPGTPPAGAAASPGIISTQAGGPGRGLVHNVAQEANWVATAPDGSVYVSDVQGVVRQFNDTSTWEKAIAGVGMVTGYGGDGGKATRARLGLLGGLALDQHQNVIVADNGNNRIRMIAATPGHLLRHRHDRRRHLHRGRQRQLRLRRRRRPGHLGGAGRPRGGDGRRRREPADLRQRQRADPGGRGHLGHLLRHGHDRRRHLHRGRQRQLRLRRRRRPGHRRHTGAIPRA